MINVFSIDNFPDGVPDEFTAGSIAAWKNVAITSAYPTASYTLKFIFYPTDGTAANEFFFTAAKTDSEHVVNETNTFKEPGEYRWLAQIIRDSDNAKATVDEGFIVVRSANGADVSHTYTTLLAIRATLQGTASREQSRIEIGGRVLEHRSIADLLLLEKEYSKRWTAEQKRVNRKAGRAAGGRVLLKMEA